MRQHLAGIQPYGHGAPVDEVDAHVRAEHARRHGAAAFLADFLGEAVEHLAGPGRIAGIGEGGAAALAAVGIQRELRHQQDIGPAIPGGAVELVAAVSFAGEDAQIQQLARHAFKNRTVVEVRAVFVTKAGHGQQPAP